MLNAVVPLLTAGRKGFLVVERSKDSSEPFVCKYQTKRFHESQDELHCLERHSLDCAVHTRTTGKYAAKTPTRSISTDTIEPLL